MLIEDPTPYGPARTKWEYEIVSSKFVKIKGATMRQTWLEDVMNEYNKYGSEGWELVSSNAIDPLKCEQVVSIFKRPIIE